MDDLKKRLAHWEERMAERVEPEPEPWDLGPALELVLVAILVVEILGCFGWW